VVNRTLSPLFDRPAGRPACRPGARDDQVRAAPVDADGAVAADWIIRPWPTDGETAASGEHAPQLGEATRASGSTFSRRTEVGAVMPEISRFFGIVIRMYQDDHAPPHFHAYYGEEAAAVAIRNLRVFRGRLRPRARRMVFEWARLHRAELLAAWDLASSGQEPPAIAPLE